MFPLRRIHGARLLQSHGDRTVTTLAGLHPLLATRQVLRLPSTTSQIQRRGKKTKTAIKLSDLPQGPIESEFKPVEEEENEPSYPTVVLQARRNMRKFDNCVLLTRVGGFYELYFEHADEYASLLNIKLASKKTTAGPVSMVRAVKLQADEYPVLIVSV